MIKNEMTVNGLQVYVGTWGCATFPEATSKSILAHLKREVVELEQAIEKNEGIAEEAADCLLILYHIAYRNSFSLLLEAQKKMEINVKRKWGEPDEEGVVEHIIELGHIPVPQPQNSTGEYTPTNKAMVQCCNDFHSGVRNNMSQCPDCGVPF